MTEALGVSAERRELAPGRWEGLEPWQLGALKALEVHDRISIRAGHGVGKTAFLAWACLWFLLTRFPCKIPVTASNQDQLRDVVWAEIVLWARRLPPELQDQLTITAEKVAIKGAEELAFAVRRTASKENPEALQGFHSENLLFLIEEASGIPDVIFEVATGALSTPGAKVLMMANPTRLSGFFYDTHHKLAHRWKTMVVNSEDVPRATGHVADIIAQYGRDSNKYKVRVLGEFPTTEDQQVIPYEWIQAAVGRNVAPLVRYRPVWGVDVARFGDDRSALAKRQNNHLLEKVKSWRGKDTMQTAWMVKDEWDATPRQMRPSEILVDVIGIGAGVVDRLYELGLPARGINVAERAPVGDEHLRMRDWLWWQGRKWFEKMDCVILDDADLIAELSATTYTLSASGKIVVSPKDEMKKTLGKSPDLADAFLLTLAAGEGVPFEEKESRDYRRRPQETRSWMSA